MIDPQIVRQAREHLDEHRGTFSLSRRGCLREFVTHHDETEKRLIHNEIGLASLKAGDEILGDGFAVLVCPDEKFAWYAGGGDEQRDYHPDRMRLSWWMPFLLAAAHSPDFRIVKAR